jgi:hypothetical protein
LHIHLSSKKCRPVDGLPSNWLLKPSFNVPDEGTPQGLSKTDDGFLPPSTREQREHLMQMP